MYSSMPRKLEGANFTDSSWYRLSNMDLSNLPDVLKFLATLEFCDAVIQAAHSSVQDELLGLIYMGFLDSVVKPALTQVFTYICMYFKKVFLLSCTPHISYKSI